MEILLAVRFVLCIVVAALIGGLAGGLFGGVLTRLGRREKKTTAESDASAAHITFSASGAPGERVSQLAAQPKTAPERKRVSVLHSSVWLHDQVLDELTPEQSQEAVDAFMTFGRKIAEDMGARFERNSGISFTLAWPAESDSPNVGSPLEAAFEMRREVCLWNQSRNVDGYRSIMVVMGADWGLALVSEGSGSVLGDVVDRAITLAHLTPSFGTDLLVTEDLSSVASPRYICDRLAEASLSGGGGRTACYRLLGYRTPDGQEVWVTAPVFAQAKAEIPPTAVVEDPSYLIEAEVKRWMVNSGSHIIGPLAPNEVGQMLFSQDLDFDCECWLGARGKRTSIAQSGMFGETSEDPGATIWVFDGETVHGPMTEGFLGTAISHGAFPATAQVCVASTLTGWKVITDLKKSA